MFAAHLDGILGQQVNANNVAYTIMETFSLGGASGCWGSQLGVGFNPCGSQNFGFGTPSFANQIPSGFDFTGTFTVTAGESTVFLTSLMADCLGGYSCDFTNTASFSISGVSYTEDSGVLFSQASNAVPEPGTMGGIGAGLLILGTLGRRRAKKAAYRAAVVHRNE
jgi:hypothetical protein